MLDPITILTTLGYAISKTGKSPGADVLTQIFGGAAGNAFHANVQQLRTAFLTIARPDSNHELERAAARSSLQANLFCLMEALGESLEPAGGKLAVWRQCAEERLPQNLRDIGHPWEGFMADAARRQLLAAKKDCEADLDQIERAFTPVDIQPNQMLGTVEEADAADRAAEALALIEMKHGLLPPQARKIFHQKWFGYLCGSFHFEIKHNQSVANILLNLSLARLEQKIDLGFNKTQQLIRDAIRPTPIPLDLYATVPPLPVSFIDRPEISGPLREKLSVPGTVGLTAIEGMGGVGKTMAALGICHDPLIRRAFPDGIVWLTVGKESTLSLEDRVKQVAQALNQDFRGYSRATYQTLLKDKAVLVVLDDVWTLDTVEPFLLSPGPSRLLFTSRDRTLAGGLGADNHEVGVLDDKRARQFLQRWSGRENAPLPEPYSSEILSQCKGLALGLAMIGAALKGQIDAEWAFLAADLEQARLKEIGVRPGGYAYETPYASIAVGVNALNPSGKSRYLELAILLEDMPASEVLLQALWGGDERDIHRTTRLFVDRSLAQREADGSIRLHDFQLDYVRSEHADLDAMRLQHLALQLSLHVIRPHPEEFTSQMIGRLIAHRSQPTIAKFLKELDTRARHPCLRPLRPALTPAGSPARRVMNGHKGWNKTMALTADGKRLISGGQSGALLLWNLENHQAPRFLKGHTGDVDAVAMSADGKRAVSGARDNTLRVWDLESDQPPRVLEGHTKSVDAVALSADGKRAVSGSFDGTLRVWDLTGNQPSRVLKGHTAEVMAVALSADGRRAVSGSHDKTVLVWDLERDQPPRVLKGHVKSIYAVALSADGTRAISGSEDATLRLWDLEHHQPPRVLKGHTSGIKTVALTSNGERAVSGAEDNTLRVWDLENDQPPRVLKVHTAGVVAVALSADGTRAVSGARDNTLRVWDLGDNQLPLIPEGHTADVMAVALSADGKRAISGSYDSTLRVWDLESDQAPRLYENDAGPVNSVALTPDGKRAVFGSSYKNNLGIWELQGNQLPRVLECDGGPVESLAMTATGRTVVFSSSHDNKVRSWDLESNQAARVLEGQEGFEGHRSRVSTVALTPQGKRALSGSNDQTLRLWDLTANQPPRVLKGHIGDVKAVALTSDGRRAVSVSSDDTLRVWDLENDKPVRVLLDSHTGLETVALNADGKRAVSGSYDHTIRIWDLEAGRCLRTFTGDAPILSCVWVGGRIMAGDGAGNIHLLAWEE
jgi:WD40 repeat protein